MKLLYKGKDGGPESTVTGYWLVEIKGLFSIALLCLEDGSREAYHSHAFNALSWLFSGELREDHVDGREAVYKPSLSPIWTSRDTFHKVTSKGRSWALTFRGPWLPKWHEFLPNENRFRTLTHGRKEL